jgi:hypothetical protein
LAEDGILIIEDIQDFKFIDILIKCVPNDFQKYIQIYDLRQITPLRILNAQRLPTFALINRRQVGVLNVQRCKNCRYDDVLFVINKTI